MKRQIYVGTAVRLADRCPYSPVCPTFTLVSSDGSGSIIGGPDAGNTYTTLGFGSSGAIVFTLTTTGMLTDAQGSIYVAPTNGGALVQRSASNPNNHRLLQCQSSMQQLTCSVVGSNGQNNFAKAVGQLAIQASSYNSQYPPVRTRYACSSSI